MKIHIYNESCVMAGETVPDRVLEQHESPDDAGDWTVYEGTPEELLEIADTIPAGRGRGFDNYYHRVARTIRECVFFERPDLDPDDADDEE